MVPSLFTEGTHMKELNMHSMGIGIQEWSLMHMPRLETRICLILLLIEM